MAAWISRQVCAYSHAPPSTRSSRATPVTVAYFRPMAATDSATRRGSPSSSGSGLPVSIWQKSHRRVHWSPPMRKVASRSSQHSKMFGQPASSQTVCRPSLRTRIVRGSDLILSTMNDLPGYEVTEVIGEVFGITVRSRNIGSSLGAAFKSLAGGELRGMTKLLSASRTEAQDRLIETAQAKGADAILAMRFDVNELQNIGQEICAYGTAVKIRRADI